MLEETEKMLMGQPAYCKIVRKMDKRYEVKLWLMNNGENSDEQTNNNVLSVNERLLAKVKMDSNQNWMEPRDGKI